MSKTYRYYGTVESRGRNYRQLPNPKPKANLGEGHPAKSNSTDFADLRKWYAKLDRDTKSAMDKAADKPDSLFTNEERNSFYLNVDPYHYNQYLQFRYPGKTEFIQDRMKSYYGFRRQLEENGIVPKKPSEVKPETQYAEQMVKNTKEEKATSTDDAESLWNVEYKPHDNSISEPKPAETKADQSAANPEKVTPEKQAAKDMVDSSKPTESYVSYKRNMQKQDTAKPADYPEFTELPMSNYYPLAYANGVYTPRLGNNSLNYSNTRHVSNYPTRDGLFYDGQYPFEAYEGMGNVKFVPMYNPHYPRERLYSRPEDYYPNPFEKRKYDIGIQRYPDMTETQRKLRDTAEVLGLGLGGIGLVGYIGGQQAQERQRQSQTQIPDQVEPESVNEDIPQVEPTLEQQYAAQDIPSFSAKINNLFDLYQQQEQLTRDRATYEAYLRAQEMGQRIASGNGYTPELREVTSVSSQEESSAKPRVSRNTDSGSATLNASNQRKPKVTPKNKADNKPAKTTSQTVSKPEAALAKALLKAQTESRAGRDDSGLQQYRYQSLLNSGLRGMTPDEAIRSGLLTPEQVQVLMRGPY